VQLGTSAQNFSFQCVNLPTNAFCVFNPPQLAVLPANVTGNVALGIATGDHRVAEKEAGLARHGAAGLPSAGAAVGFQKA
jgi:hypothetical protein